MPDIQRQSSPVVQVLGLPHEGNAVHIGFGYFLTAGHLLGDAEGALLRCSSGPTDLDATRCHQEHLAGHDLALLRVDEDPSSLRLGTAVITSLDRWEELTIKGWLRTIGAGDSEQGSRGTVVQEREFRGMVEGWARPGPDVVPLRELHLNPAAEGSIQGMSGSGVFNQALHSESTDGEHIYQLVGILSHEQGASPGQKTEKVYFASLEAWPSLWADGVQIGDWQPDLPTPWRNEWNDVSKHQRVLSREPIFAAIQTAFQQPVAKNGYLVILGGPQRGKSAVMAELIRRAGPTNCLWLFATRHQTDLMGAENTLIQQLAYLLGRRKDEAEKLAAQVNQPSTVLGALLNEWARRKERLLLYIDALDELAGAENVAFLPNELPDDVYVVISLRHEPRRRAVVTRYRPCLGVVNLDGVPTDWDDVRHLLSLDDVQQSNKEATDHIWSDWETVDGHAPLPEELRRTIYDNYSSIVGYHGTYARILAQRVQEGRYPPPLTDVPKDPEDINRQFWDDVMDRMPAGEEKQRCRFALGLIAAARTSLVRGFLQNLVGWSSVDEVDQFLTRAGPVLIDFRGELSAHHITWNDMVRERLKGAELADCHEALANRVPGWPMQKMDQQHQYWLRYRPYHLMSIIEDEYALPDQREAARTAWLELMGDPVYLANRGALDGVDALIADLNRGVYADMPQPAEWWHALTIFNRQLDFLRDVSRQG
jgi:hypothetical protein